MLTQRLYNTYKARGYTDEQVCTLAGVPRSALKKFKPKKNDVPPELMKKAADLGIHPDTVKWRMDNKHWTAEVACTTPKDESTVTMEQLREAKRKYGLHPSSIYRRLERGMDLEQALTTPSIRKKKRGSSMANKDKIITETSNKVMIRVSRIQEVLSKEESETFHQLLKKLKEQQSK